MTRNAPNQVCARNQRIHLVGIEILDASRRLHPDILEEAEILE